MPRLWAEAVDVALSEQVRKARTVVSCCWPQVFGKMVRNWARLRALNQARLRRGRVQRCTTFMCVEWAVLDVVQVCRLDMEEHHACGQMWWAFVFLEGKA